MALLKGVVARHLLTLDRKNFVGMDSVEAQLRKKCLHDRLTRIAQDKYRESILKDERSWLHYLKGARGKTTIEKWLDRKIEESMSKWRVRR